MRWKAGADVAVLQPSAVQGGLPAGPVTLGRLLDALPMGDVLVSLELDGKRLLRLLEQQWQGRSSPVALVMAGLRVPWQPGRRPPRGPLRPDDVRLDDGRPLAPAGLYRLATTRFLAGGGLRFTAFLDARPRREHGPLVEALAEFLAAGGAAAPPPAAPAPATARPAGPGAPGWPSGG